VVVRKAVASVRGRRKASMGRLRLGEEDS